MSTSTRTLTSSMRSLSSSSHLKEVLSVSKCKRKLVNTRSNPHVTLLVSTLLTEMLTFQGSDPQ
jgi:hypothetical protein